jgi:hypothetical protein
MKMERLDNTLYYSQITYYGLKLFKGDFIDNWISFNVLSNNYNNIIISENSIKIFYSSFMQTGEIFEVNTQIHLSSGDFNIEFSTNFLNLTKAENSENEKFPIFNFNKIYIDSLNGTFYSNYGINIKFEMSLKSEEDLYIKITMYSFFYIYFFLALQILNNILLIRKIGNSISICNTVNISFINFFKILLIYLKYIR